MYNTTEIARDYDMPAKELFEILDDWGLISRNEDDKWEATALGERFGATMIDNPKYGLQLKWSKKLNLDRVERTLHKELLSSTQIGQKFNVSAQKVNKIFQELAWVENGVEGWMLTEAGSNNGGVEFEASNGTLYVKWSQEILNNRGLLGWVKADEKVESPPSSKTHSVKPSTIQKLNEKYPPTVRTTDGHMVRSLSESKMDDWLYLNGIVHAYERVLPTKDGKRNLVPDFFVPSAARPGAHGVFIEFWGMTGDEEYEKKRKEKIRLYKENGYEANLIEIFPDHLKDLDTFLSKELLKKAKIKIGF